MIVHQRPQRKNQRKMDSKFNGEPITSATSIQPSSSGIKSPPLQLFELSVFPKMAIKDLSMTMDKWYKPDLTGKMQTTTRPTLKKDTKSIDIISHTHAPNSTTCFSSSNRGIVVSLHPGLVRPDLLQMFHSNRLIGKFYATLLIPLYPLLWLSMKSPSQGNQTTMFTLLSDKVESGKYYADCAVSRENTCVNKQNWDQLWRISQQMLGVKFNP